MDVREEVHTPKSMKMNGIFCTSIENTLFIFNFFSVVLWPSSAYSNKIFLFIQHLLFLSSVFPKSTTLSRPPSNVLSASKGASAEVLTVLPPEDSLVAAAKMILNT